MPKHCFIVYSKSRFLRQADFLRCQDTYLCTKNRHRVYLVENPVDNCFSLWITLYHAVFNTTSPLVYSVRCPSVNPGAVLSWRGAVVQHAPKKYFFRVFSEKIFSRVYIVSVTLSKKREKIAPKNFLEKRVDMGRPKVYYRDTPRGTPQRHPLCGVRYPVREVERLTVLHRSR